MTILLIDIFEALIDRKCLFHKLIAVAGARNKLVKLYQWCSILRGMRNLGSSKRPTRVAVTSVISFTNTARRRSSMARKTFGKVYAHASSPRYPRRGFSLMSRIEPNRFPVRPDDNSNNVTSAYSQRRRSQLARAPGPRTFSSRSGFTSGGNFRNTPPYTADLVPLHIRDRQNPPAHSADPFMFEYPKEFPLRPTDIGKSPTPTSPKVPPMGSPILRWKGGMPQRQRSGLSLRRRAQTFSPGAVTAGKNDQHTGLTGRTCSSLTLPNATSNLSSAILSHKKIDDARQNGESNDEKGPEEANTVGLESTDPSISTGFDILVEKSAESTDLRLYRATPVSGIEIEDPKARSNDQNLRSVVVDKSSSKPTLRFTSSLSDSMT